MYDIKLVRRAKLYSDAMAQGINPLNGVYFADIRQRYFKRRQCEKK